MPSWLFALAAAAAPPAAAVESVYTELDLDRCELIERIEEGDSVRWNCPGRGGMALLVSSGDGRFDIDAGTANDEWETLAQFNNPGPRVEWRVADGTPFAIIFRLASADGDHPGSALFVETIGRPGAAGCTIAVVDAATPDANALARRLADARARTFTCGTDAVERVPAG